MEDLDLDELDQAVNKMMTKPAKRGHKKPQSVTVPTSSASVPVVPSDTSVEEPKPAESSMSSTPEPDSTPSTLVPVSRPMPKVPPRRRVHPGAMDIIQPNTPKMGAPSAVPSRAGRDISPVKSVTPEPARPVVKPVPVSTRTGRDPEDEAAEVADEVLAALTLQDQPVHKPPAPAIAAPTPVSKPAEPKKAADSSWPDPLDFHDFSDTKEKEKPSDTESEDAPTMDQKRADPDSLMDDAAASTPFVTTKVEKRPLGAYSDAAAQTSEKSEPEEVSVTDEAPSKGEMAAAAIKSNQHLDKPDEDEHDMNKLRKMSIPQQYHTAEQKPNEEVHSLFDTKEYHAAPQQIGHAAKKGGSAWFAIMVVVLIVLLIAAVVVGYLMMSGNLDINNKLW